MDFKAEQFGHAKALWTKLLRAQAAGVFRILKGSFVDLPLPSNLSI